MLKSHNLYICGVVEQGRSMPFFCCPENDIFQSRYLAERFLAVK